ncbi:hypothetical protein GRI89_16595 [Altererythrobacter salegens]|uniref:Phytase-like domain-containing protein n=1 Tax=Croceibacterium salegens TaxID=1737568 RepID=A0A6I4SYH3_9SPHN|nr:SdiA-regulated domain-containing protein [Croceibacterium salegens]MXO61164.1 hypothetical protein [Croceibacterium salegens]
MIRLPVAAPLLAVLACCGAAPEGNVSFALGNELQEVSGLAVAGPNSVFAHDDEYAIVYEIDLEDGHVRRTFALGDPTIEGDFEGIAYSGGDVFLISSDGLIYAARPGKSGQRVPYTVYDSGVGARCEIEGLTNAPEAGHLLILCKRLRKDEGKPRLEIYTWRIGDEQAAQEPWLSRPLRDLLKRKERAEFAPSGFEWDESNSRLFVVSGRNRLLLQIDRNGNLLAKDTLDHQRHPQTEGIAVIRGCRLLLADEGSRTRKATLAQYPCPPRGG